MPVIDTIQFRKVLNSHVEFTNEFIIKMQDGSIGIGSSPQGETISIYEDRKVLSSPRNIIRTIDSDGYLGRSLDQAAFDQYLQQRIPAFGRNNAYALSLAFFMAASTPLSPSKSWGHGKEMAAAPYLCLNILNGGRYAYTNPVLSDFSEYILVSKSHNLEEVIGNHNEIQRTVKERLAVQSKVIVSGNPVSRFSTTDNRECIEFLFGILEHLGLKDRFDLMVDASAGDLWTPEGYRLTITDHSLHSEVSFHIYWLNLIRQYGIRFLEDPFREEGFESWRNLATSEHACKIIGDNFYSSDAARIKEGAANQCTHGAIIKPNQSGTVTAVRQAIEAAQRAGQIVITSHRSISTESTFLSNLTCSFGVKYIKIGPLMTDYSAVIRLNEIIRLTGGGPCS